MDRDRRNNLYDKSLEFGKEIISLYREFEKKSIGNESYKRMLNSGTSVGAFVSEAQGSVSESDYMATIQNAYKELLKVRYWLELFNLTGDIDQSRAIRLDQLCDELSKILYTIIKSIKQKTGQL